MNAPLSKADVPSEVTRVLERPARWAPAGSYLPAYDGHDRTLQVQCVNSQDGLACLERLEPYRKNLERAAGGPLVIIYLPWWP